MHTAQNNQTGQRQTTTTGGGNFKDLSCVCTHMLQTWLFPEEEKLRKSSLQKALATFIYKHERTNANARTHTHAHTHTHFPPTPNNCHIPSFSFRDVYIYIYIYIYARARTRTHTHTHKFILWFRTSLICINNCPTRCNTKQSIYYSASSLYMFRVSNTPIIRSSQNCNYSLLYWS